MGFSIWVADHPGLTSESEDYSDVPAEVWSRYPQFSTSLHGMDALRAEMHAQGMLDFIVSSNFGFSDGEHVSASEITSALAVARANPVTATDDEMRELWSSWLAFLRLAPNHGGIRVY